MAEVDDSSADVTSETETVAPPVEPSAAAAPVTPMSEQSEQGETEDAAEAEAADEAAAGEPRAELKPFHPAPANLALDRIDEDDTFKARDEGDVAALAMDIARLGQLFPIDVRLKPPDRFQVVTGFRRVAALKFLHREKVLARLHVGLSDDDAGLIALAEAIHAKSVSREDIQALSERLEANGKLSAVARDMLDKALALDEALAPEEIAGEEEEVDADELASDVTQRLGQINQDLSLLADVFKDLDPDRRAMLLEQLKYSADLVAFLEGLA